MIVDEYIIVKAYDPKDICPAAGYEKIIPTYEADPAIPVVDPVEDLSDDQIVLICSTIAGGSVSFTLLLSDNTKTFTYEIYGDGNALLTSGTIAYNGAFTYTFTTAMNGYLSDTGEKYFRVLIRPTTTGNILTARVTSTSTIYPIIEAYFKTPQLVTLNFDGQSKTKKIWMSETMNSWTSSSLYTFRNTYELASLTLPLSANAVTNITNWFYGTGCPEVLMPASMTSLATWNTAFQYAKTRKVTLPTTVNTALTPRLDYVFNDMPFLTDITFPDTWYSVFGLFSTFKNLEKLKWIKFPATYALNSLTNAFSSLPSFLGTDIANKTLELNLSSTYAGGSNVFVSLPLVEKIILTGDGSGITGATAMVSTCNSLNEFRYPSKISGYQQCSFYCSVLKKVVLPDDYSSVVTAGSVEGLFCSSSSINVQEVTTCANWGTTLFVFLSQYATKLKRFDQPTIRLSNVGCNGTAGAPRSLEYFDIDWANCTDTIIELKYNQLSASEINRIFTALPTVSGRTIQVSGNPGYATCTPSIATAKGWTVN